MGGGVLVDRMRLRLTRWHRFLELRRCSRAAVSEAAIERLDKLVQLLAGLEVFGEQVGWMVLACNFPQL